MYKLEELSGENSKENIIQLQCEQKSTFVFRILEATKQTGILPKKIVSKGYGRSGMKGMSPVMYSQEKD